MSNYSYVTLLTSDSYIDGIILLKESLRIVKTRYPLLCLITENISDNIINILKLENINYRLIKNIPASKEVYEHNKLVNSQLAEIWKDTFTKFRIWELEEYDKLIFLDADLLILKNLDHCFEFDELTAAIDGEYFNLWLPNNKFFNSGFLVLKPSKDTFNKLLEFTNNIDPTTFLNANGNYAMIADQDILNRFFIDWEKHPERQLNKYYNVFGPYILIEHEKDLIDNCYFIHFVGIKPWQAQEFYKLTVTRDFRSSYFYCIASAIIDIVKENNYLELEELSEQEILTKAINNAKFKFFNTNTASRLALSEDDKKAAAVQTQIFGLLKYIYNNNICAGSNIFNDLVDASIGNTEVILKYYELFEKVVKYINDDN